MSSEPVRESNRLSDEYCMSFIAFNQCDHRSRTNLDFDENQTGDSDKAVMNRGYTASDENMRGQQ